MENVELFVCGDVMLGRGIDQILPWPCEPTLYEPSVRTAKDYVVLAEMANGPLPKAVGIAYPWGDALPELLGRPLAARIINLETSVTRWAKPVPKGINYRMSPENFSSVKAARIDCCVLANNHVLDWGETGLIDTLDTTKGAAISTPGAGRNIPEASMPAVLPVSKDCRILVYACAFADSGVPASWRAGKDRPGINLLPDLSAQTARQITDQIGTVKQRGDVALASIHWGGNWGYAIEPAHRRFAHTLIDQAAIDLVHGHSSHHPKAIEVHRGHLILYGCGDFITDYEGILGYEAFRDDLVLMYLPVLRRADGTLQRLTMVPFQIRNFRLRRAGRRDVEWLCSVLQRECARLGGAVGCGSDNLLQLNW